MASHDYSRDASAEGTLPEEIPAVLRSAERHQAALFRFASEILSCPASAEEIVVRSLLSVSQTTSEVPDEAAEKLALFQRVWKACHSEDGTLINELRERSLIRQIELNRNEGETRSDPMYRAVLLLPRLSRAVFFLVDIQRLSKSDAAEIIGTSEEECSAILHRARQLVRRNLLRSISDATEEVVLIANGIPAEAQASKTELPH